MIPEWLAAQKPCYKKIVDKWVSDAFKNQHKVASDRRKLVGEHGVHRQGPLTLDGVIANKVINYICSFHTSFYLCAILFIFPFDLNCVFLFYVN